MLIRIGDDTVTGLAQIGLSDGDLTDIGPGDGDGGTGQDTLTRGHGPVVHIEGGTGGLAGVIDIKRGTGENTIAVDRGIHPQVTVLRRIDITY